MAQIIELFVGEQTIGKIIGAVFTGLASVASLIIEIVSLKNDLEIFFLKKMLLKKKKDICSLKKIKEEDLNK